MKWLRYGGLGLALMGVGCESSSDGIPQNQPVQMQAQLKSFDGCEDLESYIEDTAVLDMRAQAKGRRRSSNWGRGGPIYAVDDSAPPMSPSPDDGGGAGSPSPGTGDSGPDDYTGTNNQVEGVDEADFVKNDGTRIFAISGRTLYAHRSWPAESLAAVQAACPSRASRARCSSRATRWWSSPREHWSEALRERGRQSWRRAIPTAVRLLRARTPPR